jgi:hypothetical protein
MNNTYFKGILYFALLCSVSFAQKIATFSVVIAAVDLGKITFLPEILKIKSNHEEHRENKE